MDLFITVFLILFGLIIGSFLTVCIYRIPYGKEMGPPSWEEMNPNAEPSNSGPQSESSNSHEVAQPELAVNSEDEDDIVQGIATPRRSLCPHCKNQLLWYHNIPLFSWVFLGGRCAFCKSAISFRYPLVELLTVVAALLSYHLYGFTPTAGIVFAFTCALIVISFIDIDYYIIPDVISIPGTILGILVGAVSQVWPNTFGWPVTESILSSLLGALLGGGILFAVSWGYYQVRGKIGLGLGDVKLLAMTGAFFGPAAAFYSIFVGSLAGAVLGVLLLLVMRKSMSQPLPFGPYLALGTLLYLFAGKYIPIFQPLVPPLH